MNKFDRLLVIFLVLLSIASLYYFRIIKQTNHLNEAVVIFDGEEVLRINLNDTQELKTYVVEGYNGQVVIEALDQQIRVIKESSPYHLCSLQGWTDTSVQPIICLPNKVLIEIDNDSDLGVDGVIR